jgi:hypothetical protein
MTNSAFDSPLGPGFWKPFTLTVAPGRVLALEIKRVGATRSAPITRALAHARQAANAVLPYKEHRAAMEEFAKGMRELTALQAAEEAAKEAGTPITRSPEEEAQTHERHLERLDRTNRYRLRNTEAEAAYIEAIPVSVLEAVFSDDEKTKIIRNVRLDVDGVEVTDPAALREVIDITALRWLLDSIESRCSLSEQEGKASASPSTSGAEAERTPTSSDSPAPPIESEASPAVSTVMETPTSE